MLPSIDWSVFNDTTVIVETRALVGTNALREPVYGPPVACYSGAANVYEREGAVDDSPVGRVLTRVLKVLIDPDGAGALPAIPVGSRVRIIDPNDGLDHRYLVVDVRTWMMEPSSVELTCDLRKSW